MRDPVSESALDALPIFPLPNVVLFPGAVIPLHIFEARYRDMARDALDGHGLLALARLCPGYEHDYDQRPAIYPTAGVGSILASDLLPDGRYNLLVRGIGRVQICEELPPRRSYREGRAQPLADLETSRPEALAKRHHQLISLCDRLADFLDEDGHKLRELARACEQPGGCVDLVAAALVTEPDDRQELLETLDPADRTDAVIDHVGRLIAEHGARTVLPN